MIIKILKIFISIVFLVIIYFTIFFVIQSYGDECKCYGIKIESRCVGIKSICSYGIYETMITIPDYKKEFLKSCKSNISNDQVIIDFKLCKQCKYIIYKSLGSTEYKILGESVIGFCDFSYIMEVNNNTGSNIAQVNCRVPIEIGELRFNINESGIDFGDISRYYCY